MGTRSAQPLLSLSFEQTLRASDEILQLLPIATCICDADGRIVQYNQRAVDLWGQAPQPGQSYDEFTGAWRFFGSEGSPHSKVAEVLRTGQAIHDEEVTVRRTDGREIVVLIHINPLVDANGKLAGVINCFQDITDRKRIMDALDRSQHDLRLQEARWNATYEHAAIGIVELDAEGRFLRVNEAICAITGGTHEEMLGWKLFERTYPDDRDVDAELYRRQVAGDIGFYSIEKRLLRRDGRVVWIGVRSSTVRDATGHFLYGVRVIQDITERKEAEERQKLLIDELNHRVKNTLATVQSLATQTARGTDSPQAFRAAFEGRLIALSHAHDQLTRRHWRSADLRDLVESATAPYRNRAPDRIVITGEPLTVTPRVALTLALLLHELTTNAAKYGALSVPGGRLIVDWDLEPAAKGSALLRMEWRERGGPPVQPPTRQGFGSRFIVGSIKSELQGKARLDYQPDGLVCTMEIPIEAHGLNLADKPV